MPVFTVAGQEFDLGQQDVEGALAGVDPEPIREHYVVIASRRYPPKQVLAKVTGLDRADFTTHQARSVLRRLGFGVSRREAGGAIPAQRVVSTSTVLEPFIGRWVAQRDDEVLFDSDSPQAVLNWLRRHGLSARVWQVPSTAGETGSSLSTP